MSDSVEPSRGYDVVIVGAGMFGSSAARHAMNYVSNGRQLTVCLIGPQEPTSRNDHTILAAHYDEARITRIAATDPLWAALAIESIARYRQLERETGIHFYDELGCLTIGNKSSSFITRSSNVKSDNSIHLSDKELLATFPYLGNKNDANNSSIFCGVSEAILEKSKAGIINPRRLIQAQQRAAQQAGCHVIRDVVSEVVEDTKSSGPNGEVRTMKITTDGGLKIRAGKVLLATGAFVDFRRLLPPGVRLDLHYLTQSVIFAQLSLEDMEKMRNMPSMVVKNTALSKIDKTEWENEFDCYILPPVKYPDGKTYVKLGHGCQLERELKSPNDVIDWYRNPVPEHDKLALSSMLFSVFPDLKPLSVHYDTCVTTHTPPWRPFIDLLSPSLGVALGGNGYAAKSSDEIGRMAIDLLIGGTWSHDLPSDAFKAIRVDGVSKL